MAGEKVSLVTRDVYLSRRNHPVGTIAMVDDRGDNILTMAPAFTRRGYTFIGFTINPYLHPTLLQERALVEQVMQSGAQVVISDKGLGYVDGIELIQRIRENGILTIMFTGEHQTRETHRVAHEFVTKPNLPTYLVRVVESLLNGTSATGLTEEDF